MTPGRLARLDAPESVSQRAYDAIRDAIVDKDLPPGGAVREADLARQLGVSKTPVREALLRLREVGLVEGDGTRGARVVRPSRDAIAHAYEVRWALEPAVAGLAAIRGSAEQRQEIKEAAKRSLTAAEAHAADEFRRCDWTFHEAIADVAASPRLAMLAKNALALSAVLRARDVPFGGDSVTCARQHVGIADAIDRGDETSARRLAAQHVEDVLRLVLASAVRDPLLDDGTTQPLADVDLPVPEARLGDGRRQPDRGRAP